MSLVHKQPRQPESSSQEQRRSEEQGDNPQTFLIAGPGPDGGDQANAGQETDNPAQADESSDNPLVLKYKNAVQNLATYTADYQMANYAAYLRATHMSPVMGKDFFQAVAVGALGSAVSSGVVWGLKGTLSALGSLAGPVGTVIGFMVGTAVGYLYEFFTDTSYADLRKKGEGIVDIFEGQRLQVNTQRDAVHAMATSQAAPGGVLEKEADKDPDAFEAKLDMARAERDAMQAKKDTPDQLGSLLAIWKRQNVDEVHSGGWGGENGHSRADVDNEQWKKAGGKIRDERALYTHMIDGELARAGLAINSHATDTWRKDIESSPTWAAEAIASACSGAQHALVLEDPGMLVRWLSREGEHHYGYQYDWASYLFTTAVFDEKFSAKLSYDLEVSQGCVEAEAFHYVFDFPTVVGKEIANAGAGTGRGWSPLNINTRPHEKH